MAHQTFAVWYARHVGRVADQVGGLRERLGYFRRNQTCRARAKAGNGEPAAHGRRPRPWIRIIEKYGASSSVFSVSGITFSPAMVPRST